jgi:protease-4
MNYSLVRSVLSGVWALSAQAFLEYEPLARAILSGSEFAEEGEPEGSLPFMVARGGFDSRVNGNTEKPSSGLVAVTPLVGVMLKYDTMCGPVGTQTIASRLLQADKDPDVVGHILLIDSGGGEVRAINPLHSAIHSITKPILAFCDAGVMASSAMYVAAYCDEILAANDTSQVGSIGTMISLQGRPQESEDDKGIKYVRIYADSSPDKNNEYEQALQGNFSLIKENFLNPFDRKFMDDIKTRRPAVTDKQLQGGTFMAKDVIGSLIDAISSFDQAVERVYQLAEQKKQTSNISQMNYPILLETLNLPALEKSGEGVYLSLEYLQMIEEKMFIGRTHKSELEALKQSASNMESLIATQKAEIEQLQARISELEDEDATEETTALKQKDEIEAAADDYASYEHNRQADKFLNN